MEGKTNFSDVLKLEIRDNFDVFLFTTSNFRINDEELTIVIKQKDIKEYIQENQTLHVITNDIDGNRKMYRAFTVTVEESMAQIAIISTECEKDLPERRQFPKLDTNIRSQIYEAESKGQPLKFSTPLQCRILNINQGGILLNNCYLFYAGDKIITKLKLENDEITVKAKILRAQKSTNADRITGYGCQFIDISPEAEEKIREYVYNEISKQVMQN